MTASMLRVLGVVFAALAPLLSGCWQDHTASELGAFLAEAERLRCEQVTRCAAPTSVNVWRTAAPEVACEDVWSYLRPTGDRALGRMRFDPTRAADCLARVEDSCSFLPLTTLCPGVIEGLGTSGAPCLDDLECAADHFCVWASEACAGTCRPRPISGPCEVGCARCIADGSVEGRCAAAAPAVEVGAGERCDRPDGPGLCPPMHYCLGTCRPFPGEGEACGEHWPVCAPGLGCRDGVCQRAHVVALGEPCDEVLSFCDRFHGQACRDGRCAPLGACEPAWSGIDCPGGALCLDGACVPAPTECG